MFRDVFLSSVIECRLFIISSSLGVTNLCEFWPAEHFFSMLFYPYPSYSSSLSPFLQNPLWRHHPILNSTYQSSLLQLPSTFISFAVLSLSILATCPIQLILCALINYLITYLQLCLRNVCPNLFIIYKLQMQGYSTRV